MPASADDGVGDALCLQLIPDLPPRCPVSDAVAAVKRQIPDPPPTAPSCELDDPRYPRCTGYVREEFLFQATNPNSQTQPSTLCKVVLEGASPPGAYGYDRLQYRVSNDCDGILRRVDLDVRVKDALNTRGSAPSAYCHQGSHFGCGDLWLASTGDTSGLEWGAYTIEATVRFALDEGQPGDPWVVTPGTQPGDSVGSCAPGGYVTRCNLSLGIDVDPV